MISGKDFDNSTSALLPVRKIIDFSVVDGPGARLAIFVQGCPLHCKFCHNPETQSMTQLVEGMTKEQILDKVQSAVPFIRGITISGGECMLYAEFIENLFSDIKKQYGFLECSIDTSGAIAFKNYPRLLSVVDSVFLDVKEWGEARYCSLTGGDFEVLKENYCLLLEKKLIGELRLLCDGEVIETKNILQSMLEQGGKYRVEKYPVKLIKFRPNGVLGPWSNKTPPSSDYMEELKKFALSIGYEDVSII